MRKNVLNSKVDCLAGFCHCPMTAVIAYSYASVLLSFVQKWNKK